MVLVMLVVVVGVVVVEVMLMVVEVVVVVGVSSWWFSRLHQSCCPRTRQMFSCTAPFGLVKITVLMGAD